MPNTIERPVLKIPDVVMFCIWRVGNPLDLTAQQKQEWLDTGITQFTDEQLEQLDLLIRKWWSWGEFRVETDADEE